MIGPAQGEGPGPLRPTRTTLAFPAPLTRALSRDPTARCSLRRWTRSPPFPHPRQRRRGRGAGQPRHKSTPGNSANDDTENDDDQEERTQSQVHDFVHKKGFIHLEHIVYIMHILPIEPCHWYPECSIKSLPCLPLE